MKVDFKRLGGKNNSWLKVFLYFPLFFISCSLLAGYYETLDQGKLPDGYPDDILRGHTSFNENTTGYNTDTSMMFYILAYLSLEQQQQTFIKYGMYFVPSKQWMDVAVQKIKQHGGTKGIDPMAGNGWLPYFFTQEYKLPVIAIDNGQIDFSRNTGPDTNKIAIQKKDAITGISENPEANFLLLSWPTNPDQTDGRDVAFEILQAWGEKGCILFIGEWDPPLTGSLDFFNYLKTHYTIETIPNYLSRRHINDNVYFCTPEFGNP